MAFVGPPVGSLPTWSRQQQVRLQTAGFSSSSPRNENSVASHHGYAQLLWMCIYLRISGLSRPTSPTSFQCVPVPSPRHVLISTHATFLVLPDTSGQDFRHYGIFYGRPARNGPDRRDLFPRFPDINRRRQIRAARLLRDRFQWPNKVHISCCAAGIRSTLSPAATAGKAAVHAWQTHRSLENAVKTCGKIRDY